MSITLPKFRKNKSGVFTPVLLVGALGTGKETNFVKSLKNANPSIEIHLIGHPEDDGAGDISKLTSNKSSTPEATAKIEETGRVAVLYRDIDSYSEDTLSDLVEMIGENKNKDTLFILSCKDTSNLPSSIAPFIQNIHRIDFEIPPKMPVMLVSEHESSELHEYGFNAAFLAKYPAQIEQPIAQGMLTSLSSLMKAMEGVKGGILGQEACDRGMDVFMVKALSAFSREFLNSENDQARAISVSFISQHLACHQDPKFIEHKAKERSVDPEP